MSYNKTTWVTGDIITAEKLNNIENEVAKIDGISTDLDDLSAELTNEITSLSEDLSGDIDTLSEKVTQVERAVGAPMVASLVSQMTDQTRVYVYTGSETGYTAGNWYYYNGTAWVSGGVYNSVAVETDKTLSVEDEAADAKAVGDEIKNVAAVSDTQPSSEFNKIWVKETPQTEVQVPTVSEFNAVVGDVDDLKSELVDDWETLLKSYTHGFFAQPITVNVIEPTSYSPSYTGKIIWDKCNAGDKYKITVTGVSGLFPYIVTDNTGNVIVHGIVSQGVSDLEVTIQNDGYFGANIYGENDYVQKLTGIPKANRSIINTIKTEISPKFENKYIGTNETIDINNPGTYSGSYAGGYVFQKCSAGETFMLTISNTANGCYDIAIYDSDGALIANSLVGRAEKELVNWTVIIPNNGAYIGINVTNDTGKIIYYKKSNGKIFSDIWTAIESLDNQFKGKKGVAFGTSLTQRSDGGGTYGYLTKLRELLECDIENNGTGGAYWFYVQSDSRSITYTVENYTDYADKDFVIIEGCVNDWYTSKILGSYTDNGYTSVCGCLRKMIEHVYSQNPLIQIYVILDHYGKNNGSINCDSDVIINGKTQYEYYSELKKVCEYCGIPVICEYAESNIGMFGEQYLVDNIHCNELGANQSGYFIASAMQRIGIKVNT